LPDDIPGLEKRLSVRNDLVSAFTKKLKYNTRCRYTFHRAGMFNLCMLLQNTAI